MEGKYRFVAYNPEWVELARGEIWRLHEVLGEDLPIEHMGSTAVPGLGGEGIIDLCLEVAQLPQIDVVLTGMGYEHKLHADDPGKRWFWLYQDDQMKRVFHLHVVSQAGGEMARMVRFRDYLRTNPEEVHVYARLKRAGVQAAQEVKGRDRKKRAYMAEKEAWIQGVMSSLS